MCNAEKCGANHMAANSLASQRLPRLRLHFYSTMSLLELGPIIFGGVEGIITYLRGNRLLAQSKTCTR